MRVSKVAHGRLSNLNPFTGWRNSQKKPGTLDQSGTQQQVSAGWSAAKDTGARLARSYDVWRTLPARLVQRSANNTRGYLGVLGDGEWMRNIRRLMAMGGARTTTTRETIESENIKKLTHEDPLNERKSTENANGGSRALDKGRSQNAASKSGALEQSTSVGRFGKIFETSSSHGVPDQQISRGSWLPLGLWRAAKPSPKSTAGTQQPGVRPQHAPNPTPSQRTPRSSFRLPWPFSQPSSSNSGTQSSYISAIMGSLLSPFLSYKTAIVIFGVVFFYALGSALPHAVVKGFTGGVKSGVESGLGFLTRGEEGRNSEEGGLRERKGRGERKEEESNVAEDALLSALGTLPS
ncbi:hypothetical protein BJ742DRAFT_839423 [Cladochytrium replicatum]|nr:hypothetical protein BJ742DRAFT_839423 [Cladochytrium replicatum]